MAQQRPFGQRCRKSWQWQRATSALRPIPVFADHLRHTRKQMLATHPLPEGLPLYHTMVTQELKKPGLR